MMFKSSCLEFSSPYLLNVADIIFMCRKKMIGGQRRRSPRISAMDSSSKEEDLHQNHRLTRSCRSKRNLDHNAAAAALPPLSKLPKQVWKGRDSPENADHPGGVEWRSRVMTNDKESAMPEKHILELLLDTLQRRDTHEIFAQPVDPHQVDNYYEIIKDPMDFGTMRAKLHEGMYKSLQEFERDVFLIPENAMRFNSSSTAYFRQARAIHELANKVFHVLHTNPDSFVSEFSGTRRRSMRKALSRTKDKDVCPLQSPSTSTFRASNRKSSAAVTERAGSGDGRFLDPQVADRRDTYLCKNEEDPLHSSFYSSGKYSLVLMNEGEISYKDSLMSYLTGLGPTAQRVAKRKLSGDQFVAAKEFKTFRDFAPAPASCNAFAKASNMVHLKKDGEEAAKLRDIRKEKTDTPSPKVTTLKNRNAAPMVRDSNCSSRPVILALENHHSKSNVAAAEFKSRNKKSCIASRPASEEADQQKKKALPLISHFTFDLPFLKARLDQMKAVEIGLKGRPPESF